MTPAELRERTRQFAILISRAARPLLSRTETRHAADQVARSSASVAANYRAACLARSRAEFVSKLGIVVEEIDEVVFWLDFLRTTESGDSFDETLIDEARQLARIFVASRRTARRHLAAKDRDPKADTSRT